MLFEAFGVDVDYTPSTHCTVHTFRCREVDLAPDINALAFRAHTKFELCLLPTLSPCGPAGSRNFTASPKLAWLSAEIIGRVLCNIPNLNVHLLLRSRKAGKPSVRAFHNSSSVPFNTCFTSSLLFFRIPHYEIHDLHQTRRDNFLTCCQKTSAVGSI